jgi:hypothetical protein
VREFAARREFAPGREVVPGRESTAGVAERCRRVEERAAAAELRHRELVRRLERAEIGLGQLQAALPRRRRRIATLREHIAALREQRSVVRTGAAVEGEPPRRLSRPDRLGTALLYAGCLVLVWLLFWQLALAFGLR